MSRILLGARAILCAAGFLSVLATQAAQVLLEPAVDPPTDRAGSVQPQPVHPRARTTSRLIYSCVEPGLVTYADRPCNTGALPRQLRVRTPVDATGAVSTVDADAGTAATDRRLAAAAKADAAAARAAVARAETCVQLEAAADEIDSKMRTGYPAREAGRLWERWREARARLREARC